jgi:hypothetical protein
LKRHDGIVWFRGKFKVDSTLIGRAFAIEILCQGACEVYFDGMLVKKIGVVASTYEKYKSGYTFRTSMIPVSLNQKTEHVIAIRLAKFSEEKKSPLVFNAGTRDKAFGSSFYDAEVAIEEESDFHQQAIMLIFATIFGVLGIFHLILFIYYHKNRANLYYSLFTFMLFCIFFGFYTLFSGQDMRMTQKILTLETISFYTVPLFFIGILYEIFYKKLLKFFWVLAGLILISSLSFFVFNQREVGMVTIVLFFLCGLVETVRVFIKGIVNKRDGARIFLFGLFLPYYRCNCIVIDFLLYGKYRFYKME